MSNGIGTELAAALFDAVPELRLWCVAPWPVSYCDGDAYVLARRGDVVLFASLDDEKCGVASIAGRDLLDAHLYETPDRAASAFDARAR